MRKMFGLYWPTKLFLFSTLLFFSQCQDYSDSSPSGSLPSYSTGQAIVALDEKLEAIGKNLENLENLENLQDLENPQDLEEIGRKLEQLGQEVEEALEKELLGLQENLEIELQEKLEKKLQELSEENQRQLVERLKEKLEGLTQEAEKLQKKLKEELENKSQELSTAGLVQPDPKVFAGKLAAIQEVSLLMLEEGGKLLRKLEAELEKQLGEAPTMLIKLRELIEGLGRKLKKLSLGTRLQALAAKILDPVQLVRQNDEQSLLE